MNNPHPFRMTETELKRSRSSKSQTRSPFCWWCGAAFQVGQWIMVNKKGTDGRRKRVCYTCYQKSQV